MNRPPNRPSGPKHQGKRPHRAGPHRPKGGGDSRDDEPQRHRREILRVAGLPAVEALFARDPQSVQRLLVTPNMAQAATELLREAVARKIAHRFVHDEALAKIAGTPLNGGIVAETAPRPAKPFDLGQAQEWARRWFPLVILDGIGNPHNLGAIARTAAFFGLPHLAITDHPSQAAPSEAAYRVSEGGLVWLDVYRLHRLPDMLRRLSPFYTIVGTALGTGAPMPMQKLATGSKPVCLVLGNEEEGMSPAALAVCEHVATLPGAGNVQSLNVAATAAIFIHAICGGFRTR
jgi:TrmH RNA methyltransferase